MDLESPQAGHGAKALVDLLSSISDLMVERDRIEAELKTVEKRLAALGEAAADSIRSSGIANVRAAGRTWYVQGEPRISVPSSNRQAVFEAAEKLGWREEITTVATSTLKSLLAGRLKETPVSDRAIGETGYPLLAAGTPFEGLVSEYTEPCLRSRKVV